jgi:hypothetical protein
MNTVETIDYRNFRINIVQDENYSSDMLNEDDSIFLLYYHRDFWVTRKGYEKELTNAALADMMKDYFFIPVYAYIHSGVALSLGNTTYPFDCRWDTSMCGGIFILKSDTDFNTVKKRNKYAEGMIKEWNDVLSGNVYGYQVMSNDEEIDSCWGFVGDYETSGIVDEAKGIVDAEISRNAEKYGVQLELTF